MKAAIFDMDGTLLDSMGMWRSVMPNYFASLGFADGEEVNRVIEKMTFDEAATYVREHYGIEKTVAEIYKEMEGNIFHAYNTWIEAKPLVPEYLAFLQARGVRMCIATLTDRYMAEAVLGRLGLTPYFEFILTVAEAGAQKDRPDIFLQAAERLESSVAESVVFEDAPYAIRTAKEAGFTVYGIFDRAQEYPPGFTDTYCDRFIRDYAEIMK